MSLECILCCDESTLFGITECNHGPFCYRCAYKMRAINKNNSCPICKHESKQIMISNVFGKFGEYKGEVLPDTNFGDVFHCGMESKKQFEKLKDFKCFVKINGKPCKNDRSFENVAFLKKHLKDDHKRLLCDICVEKKTCILEEQKLYTQAQLNKHLERGDVDDFGNIIFLHPYCGFCKNYFFDEDEFKRHMNLEHMICNVCPSDYRYTYYKNYDGLETHYKISHYICSDPNCLAKKFIAFRNSDELKLHKTEVHTVGNKKIDGKQLCAFNYGGVTIEDEVQIKDKEGINMQDQFLTLKKSKNRAIGEADQQEDLVIDLRDFYHCTEDEDQHLEEALILRHKSQEPSTKVLENEKAGEKKKKYIQKEEYEKEKPEFAKENESFPIEELRFVKIVHASKLEYKDFQKKLSKLLSDDDLKKLEGWKIKNNKRQLSSSELLDNFYQMMKKVSLKAGYEIFPHFVRTVQNEDLKNELEYEYVKSIKKLPSKLDGLLYKCKTYGALFKEVVKLIETNIEMRIRNGSLSLKRPIRREKERLFQLIGVVRRLKTQEMAKFKFASNFGVQLSVVEMIIEKIFKKKDENIQSKINSISNEELIDLLVFTKYCYDAITHNESMHLAKNKIHENVLEDYLFDRPELEKEFGPKKEDLKTLDELVMFEKEQEERNEKKNLKDMEKKNKNMGYHAKANFSLNDKNDFPDLVVGNKNAQSIPENYADVAETAKSKPATYQKKINELFPTLGDNSNDSNQGKKEEKVVEKKEKAWWEKINETKNTEIEDEEVVKVRKGKNKNQKWVSGKGFFGH